MTLNNKTCFKNKLKLNRTDLVIKLHSKKEGRTRRTRRKTRKRRRTKRKTRRRGRRRRRRRKKKKKTKMTTMKKNLQITPFCV